MNCLCRDIIIAVITTNRFQVYSFTTCCFSAIPKYKPCILYTGYAVFCSNCLHDEYLMTNCANVSVRFPTSAPPPRQLRPCLSLKTWWRKGLQLSGNPLSWTRWQREADNNPLHQNSQSTSLVELGGKGKLTTIHFIRTLMVLTLITSCHYVVGSQTVRIILAHSGASYQNVFSPSWYFILLVSTLWARDTKWSPWC